MESVLGASPRGFESRILRRCDLSERRRRLASALPMLRPSLSSRPRSSPAAGADQHKLGILLSVTGTRQESGQNWSPIATQDRANVADAMAYQAMVTPCAVAGGSTRSFPPTGTYQASAELPQPRRTHTKTPGRSSACRVSPQSRRRPGGRAARTASAADTSTARPAATWAGTSFASASGRRDRTAAILRSQDMLVIARVLLWQRTRHMAWLMAPSGWPTSR